jgi:ribosome-binding factor A
MPKEYPRTARINAQLQRDLTDIIRTELRDPRVEGVGITSVDVSPDMRHAKIHVNVLALERKADDAARALNGAAGKLRHALKLRLAIKHIPELHFAADNVQQDVAKVSRLIHEVRSADKQFAAGRGEPDPEREAEAPKPADTTGEPDA